MQNILDPHALFFIEYCMELLKERIRKDGLVLPGNILKVSSFLNHQIDVDLLDKMGEEFARRYQGIPITRILTIEASGIAVACAAARHFKYNGKSVPVVFAKKHKSGNVPEDCLITPVHSYTHGKTYDVMLSKQYLRPEDTVLLIDDFLANGSALSGLINLVEGAGATLAGAGIVIEKGFQTGGQLLREEGIRIESLAIVDSMDPETGVVFR
jgi:xanthine phosphoribosyltransferase